MRTFHRRTAPSLIIPATGRGGQHPLICRKALPDGAEEILLGRRQGSGRQGLFPPRACAPQPRPRPARLCRGRGGLGTVHLAAWGTLRPAPTCPSALRIPPATCSGAVTARPSITSAATRNTVPPWCSVHASARAGERRTHLSGADKGFFVSLGETQSGTFGLIAAATMRRRKFICSTLADPSATPRLVARAPSGCA